MLLCGLKARRLSLKFRHYNFVKEYSSEYNDSAFKVEDTIVSRR